MNTNELFILRNLRTEDRLWLSRSLSHQQSNGPRVRRPWCWSKLVSILWHVAWHFNDWDEAHFLLLETLFGHWLGLVVSIVGARVCEAWEGDSWDVADGVIEGMFAGGVDRHSVRLWWGTPAAHEAVDLILPSTAWSLSLALRGWDGYRNSWYRWNLCCRCGRSCKRDRLWWSNRRQDLSCRWCWEPNGWLRLWQRHVRMSRIAIVRRMTPHSWWWRRGRTRSATIVLVWWWHLSWSLSSLWKEARAT